MASVALATVTAATDAASSVAATYERVSSMAQARLGFSLGTQEKDTALLAREMGWALPEHLRFRDGEEKNASGADWDLDGLNAMLAAARRREFSILIVPDVDRFARNMVKALVLEEELRRYGVRVVYKNMPTEDSPEGRFLKHSLFSIAEYEREKIRLRTARNRREKAQRGLYVGNGDAPYGYRYVYGGPKHKVCSLEPDPATAPIVQRIFRDIGRLSIREIIAELEAEGILPQRAGKLRRVGKVRAPFRDTWAAGTIRRLLHNPVYKGTATYGRVKALRPDGKPSVNADPLSGIVVPVPALVDVVSWDAAQRALDERRTVHSRYRHAHNEDRADPFELRGRLVCGHCEDRQPAPGDGSRQPFSTALSSKVCNMRRGGEPSPMRFYHCLRREGLRMRGAVLESPCVLGYARAELLERIAWGRVSAALMDPARLATGLAAAQAERGDAVAQREERLAILDAEIATARARLGRIVDEALDVPKGSETHAALLYRQKQTETLLARLSNEREHLADLPTPGLTHDEAAALQRFAAEVRNGLGKATAAERAEIYRLLRLRGTVRLDPTRGIQVGRLKVAVRWEAIIPLCDDGTSFL